MTGQPSGTPLPLATITDPLDADYGKTGVAVDPGSWCASGSASTIAGIPTCD